MPSERVHSSEDDFLFDAKDVAIADTPKRHKAKSINLNLKVTFKKRPLVTAKRTNPVGVRGRIHYYFIRAPSASCHCEPRHLSRFH